MSPPSGEDAPAEQPGEVRNGTVLAIHKGGNQTANDKHGSCIYIHNRTYLCGSMRHAAVIFQCTVRSELATQNADSDSQVFPSYEIYRCFDLN